MRIGMLGGDGFLEDKEIVDLYWERNEQAIAETDAKYGSMCMKISSNILEDLEDAKESVNDTYMTAWKIIPPKYPTFLGAFVARIVRNVSLKRHEYNNAQKRKPQCLVAFDELAEYLSGGDDVEHSFESLELAESINNFLKTQSYIARVMFLRKYWFLDSSEEIAKRYNVTVGSVNASIYRTRKKLKNHLRKEGYL